MGRDGWEWVGVDFGEFFLWVLGWDWGLRKACGVRRRDALEIVMSWEFIVWVRWVRACFSVSMFGGFGSLGGGLVLFNGTDLGGWWAVG